MRQSAHVSKRIIVVVDEALMPHVEDKWVKLPRQLRSLESFFEMPVNPLKGQKMDANFVLNAKETWLEFIEKQVIMDVLFEPFIYRNYV